MPLIVDDDVIPPGLVGRVPEPEEPEPEAEPTLGEKAGASFRTINPIFSAIERAVEDPEALAGTFTGTPADPTFDPFDGLEEPYQPFAGAFILATDAADTARIKVRIDRELEDEDVRRRSGLAGIALDFAAGATDPIFLAPFFGAASKIKAGASVLEGGLVTARAALIGATASEAALHLSRETKTLPESAANVAGATLLVAIMGAGLAKLSKVRRDRLARQIEKDLEPKPAGEPDPIEPNSIPLTAEDLAADTSVGAAQVRTTTIAEESLKSSVGSARALKATNPLLRLSFSRALETRRTVQQMVDTPFEYVKNALDIPTDVSTETKIKMWTANLGDAIETTELLFVRYRTGRTGGALRTRVRRTAIGTRDLARRGAPAGTMRYNDFKAEVGRTARRGDEHAIPEVEQAARFWRELVFEPLKDRAILGKLLPEGVTVETAISYLTRVYDIARIKARRNDFREIIVAWLRTTATGGEAEAGRAEASAATFGRGDPRRGLEGDLQQARADLARASAPQMRTAIEREIADLERRLGQAKAGPEKPAETPVGRRTRTIERLERELKTAKADREAARTERARRALAAEVKNLERNLSRARSGREKAIEQRQAAAAREEDVEDIADDIIDTILGTPTGRVPYEAVTLRRGPTMERTFNIPDELIEEFLLSDIEIVGRFYVNTLAPDAELAITFGSTDLRAALGKVNDNYRRLLGAAKTDKERVSIAKAQAADLRDLQALRDILRGTYRSPSDPHSMLVRTGRVARNWNYLRIGGGFVVNATPDIGRVVMREGLWRAFHTGIVPLITNLRAVRLAAREAKLAGTAWDMALDTRAMSIADLGDDFARYSVFERTTRAAAQNFSIINLLAPWNSMIKQWAATVIGTRILNASTAWKAGTITKGDRVRLLKSGINERRAIKIAEQFEEWGSTDGPVRVANTIKWKDGEAKFHFRAALQKDVDITIVTPGAGDRPLWMSFELGMALGQFKSFGFASTNRVLIAGLQQRDMAALNGLAMMLALGFGVYWFKTINSGREISENPGVWLTEAIDRSGVLGIVADIHNIVEKGSRGMVGMALLTGGPTLSRYQARNITGALLGPSAGTVEEAVRVFGAATNFELRRSDLKAIRRLAWYQNLFYIRALLTAAQDQTAEALDLEGR